MFNLQGSEIIIVLLLALVVLGPEKLPDAMRKMGQAYAELKKMSTGFQNEFRAAIDEPMRELRDTANVLRDSADFTKLQDGEREEKPKSGNMANLAPADPDLVPTDDPPTFDTDSADGADGPDLAAGSKPAPFADQPEAGSSDVAATLPPGGPRPLPATPPPFTGMSDSPPADAPNRSDQVNDGTADATASDPEPAAGEPTDADSGVEASDAAGDEASPDDEADPTR